MRPKKNPKKDAMENAPREAEAKKKAEDVLPVGDAALEDEEPNAKGDLAGLEDDEEIEEAEDGEPVAPGPEGKAAILPDARSTTTAAQRPEGELHAEWEDLAARVVMTELDVKRWGRIATDPLMTKLRERLSQEVETLKEEMVQVDKGDLLTKQADVRARRWILSWLSPVAFDDAAKAARTHLATFEREVGPLFIDKFKRQAGETLFAKTQRAADAVEDAEGDLAIAEEQAKAAKLAEIGAKGAETSKKAEALAGASAH